MDKEELKENIDKSSPKAKELDTPETENDNEDILVNTLKAEGNKCPVCWKINKDKCERHGHLS